MSFTLTTTEKNTVLTALSSEFNSGSLVIYSGTVPTNADASLSGNNILATLTFGATAFGAPASGTITANTITQQNATGTGTATFYRALTSGSSIICQGSVGTSGTEVILNTTSIVSGGPVIISSYTISI